MTEEEKMRLSVFETRLRQLLSLHKELKRKYADVEQQLRDKQQECEQLIARCQTLETDYANLRNAKTLSVTGSDVEKTKLRINLLVREVESCIDLLTNNEMYE
jgi:predicted nuclease with TOPRIM domain